MARFAMRTRTTAAAEKEKEMSGSSMILPLSSASASSSSSLTAEVSSSSSSSPSQQLQHIDKKVNNTTDDGSNSNNNSKDKSKSNSNSISRMGLLVLILLAVQNCSKNLVVRHVMAQQPQFLTSAAVLGSECIKLACSIWYIVFMQRQSLRSIYHYMKHNARHSLLLIVPASAYNLQMSLEYVALANLNAAMFSVLVQTKLLCTALFAALVLRKRLKRIQIVSLVLLTTGVMLCNMQNMGNSSSKTNARALLKENNGNDDEEDEEEEENGRQTKGILATLGIALSSGFASVYTEKFIKGDQQQQQQQPATSILPAITPGSAKDKNEISTELEALRVTGSHDKDDDDKNDDPAGASASVSYGLAYTQVQLAVMSIVTIGLYAAMMDWNVIVTNGLFFNFSHGAVVSVFMSALGGLIVASVLKHADSILKGYATALSVILTGILSMLIFNTQLSAIYFMGIINVVTAVILYNGQDLNQYVC